MKTKLLLLVIVCIAVTSFLYGCNNISQQKAEPYRKQIFALDTIIDLTIYDSRGEELSVLSENRINELEQKMSAQINTGEVSMINSSENRSIKVSSDTYNVIKNACEVSERTDGALDITVYPLVKLWGFPTGNYRVPSKNEIDTLLQSVDHTSIKTNDDDMSVSVPTGTQIDLGAAAKGYISDDIRTLLKENGVESAVLSFGGNVVTIGCKNGENWRIGVKYPYSEDNYAILDVSETSIVTSAADQRYFTENGKQYHHIIDPKTGYPSNSGLISVTVICESAVYADCLSTALFVMGKDKAIEYYNTYKDFDFIMLDSDNNMYYTSGLKNSFSINDDYSFLNSTIIAAD